MPEPTLTPAEPVDLGDITALVTTAGLSPEGIAESLAGFIAARDDGRLIGVAGLEEHGADGLLRSLATAPDRRSEGIAARLVDAALRNARAQGHRAVYLLTEDAAGYFERFGFRRIGREDVPSGVRTADQFTSQTCASAVVMVLELDRELNAKEA